MRTSPHLGAVLVGLFAGGLALACGTSPIGVADPDAAPDVPPGIAACDPESGDRLRLARVEGGGVSVVEQIHDAELGTRCTLASFDGVVRCRPVSLGGGLVYADAGCTVRLALPSTPLGEDTPLYFREAQPAADPCAPAQPLLSRFGAPVVMTGVETIYTGGPAACTATTAAPATYHMLEAPLAPTDLVSFSLESVGSGGRIDFEHQVGSDGSRICQGTFTDADTGQTCTGQRAEDGVVRCLPLASGVTAVFDDAGCTAPREIVVHDASCGAEVPAHVASPILTFCQDRVRLRSMGSALGDPVFTGGPGVCTPLMLASTQQALSIGPGVAPFGFAEVVRAKGEGGDRLSPIDVRIGEDVALRAGRAFDNELDSECDFVTAIDGTLRCGPAAPDDEVLGLVVTAFTDAACTVAVDVAGVPQRCADAPPAFAVRDEASGRRFYRVGGVAPPLFQQIGTCEPVGAPGFYELGAELFPSEMVEGVRFVE